MYSRHDPRLRRTLNQLSQNLESANESAQANLFTFAHDYIGPCFASVGNCVNTCTASCFPTHEERLRRNRGRSRGRAELSFDFYDDWEEEENAGLLGWGNDELDRLLQGSYSGSSQPGRQRAMSYGTRRERDGRYTSNRRKSAVHPHDGGPDPTIIPSSSYFGFLGRLPWVGRKGLKYRPSAADLVEHPGAARRTEVEQQPLIEDTDEESHEDSRNHRRKRSATTGSGHTTDSLSSRGDIFPSEDELDDAVPLDDEFAMSLERRNTGLGVEDSSNGAARLSNKSSRSRVSTRTVSSRSVREHEVKTGSNQNLTSRDIISQSGAEAVPTLSDLKREEERIRQEEEADVERKRLAARELALKRGLASDPTDVCQISHANHYNHR